MAERRLLFVPTATDAPPPDPAIAAVVVVDTAWTPPPATRPDLLPVRPVISDVLREVDLFLVSYERLEAWATALDLPGRFTVDGVSWWYRRRLSYWLWLHERLLWRAVVDACLERTGPIDAIEVHSDVAALGQVVRLIAARDGLEARSPQPPPTTAAAEPDAARSDPRSLVRRLLEAPRRRARRHELGRRASVLSSRVDDAVRAGPRPFLFLTNPLVHQVVRSEEGQRRIDPFLAPIADRLASGGVRSLVLDLGADPRDDALWPALEADPDRLPATLLDGRWASAADRESRAAKGARVQADVEAAPETPLADGGIDLAPILLAELRKFATVGLPTRIRETERATRLLRELRPAGLVLINEYGRTEWMAAARSAGVPAFAVQHGVIYPWHLGYRHPRTPVIPIADRTFLFGEYERRVLLECGGYHPDELAVSGAPRLDLARAAGDGRSEAERAAERDAVRRELGVAAGDRLLVISTTHERLHRRYYWMHALAALLDVELPNVHLVFKQHPAELDDGPYRALVDGLASAAGRAAPPMSVVRDVDLYRLLRAADAHLGLFSTVLTDAVATGTPNLVAMTQAHRDLLGYVDAGVARPVHDGAALLAALDHPVPIDEAARTAFLDDHFRPGDASGRIGEALLERAGASPG